ncbi:hypothetical protein KKH3_23010 [Pectobacterium actinidiae]|nr:hypothetical protein KKH3_23010 [Pectobacterium actinidiae]
MSKNKVLTRILLLPIALDQQKSLSKNITKIELQRGLTVVWFQVR